MQLPYKHKLIITHVAYIDDENVKTVIKLPNSYVTTNKELMSCLQQYSIALIANEYKDDKEKHSIGGFKYLISDHKLEAIKKSSNSVYTILNNKLKSNSDITKYINDQLLQSDKYDFNIQYLEDEKVLHVEDRVLMIDKILYLPYAIAFHLNAEHKPIIKYNSITKTYTWELLYVFK